MAIGKRTDLGFLVDYLRERGVSVTKNVRKILKYFQGNYVVTFTPSGWHDGVSGGNEYEFIAKKTRMDELTVIRITAELERCNVLKNKKGTHSPGGAEYEYGFTPFVERLYEDSKYKKRKRA